MNLSKSAKILISCGLFLLTLYFTSYFDLSLTIAVSTYLLLSGRNYLYLFIASLMVFLLGIVFQSFDISIRYISDLLSDAYILFVTGAILYLKSKEDFIAVVHKYYRFEKKRFSKKMFFQLCLSIAAALLFFPIFGGYIAAVLGYILFSFLSRQFSGKIAIMIGFLFLVMAAIMLLSQKGAIAEELGNYTYLFLVIGTIQEIISFINPGEKVKVIDRTIREKNIMNKWNYLKLPK